MNIKTKILIPAIALTLLVAAAILVSNIALFSDFVDDSAAARVNSALKIAVNQMDWLKTKAASAALSMTENDTITAAIAAGSRSDLLEYAAAIRERTGVDFCTITDMNGTVLARIHEPRIYGDSLADQTAIQAAMAGNSMTVVERGTVVRLSVRAAMPVFDGEGLVVGVVSAGYRLDREQFVDTVKEISGCEASVLLDSEQISTTVRRADGSRVTGTQAPVRIAQMLREGIPYTGQVDIQGRPSIPGYSIFSGPDGRVVGALYTGIYIDETEKTIQAFVQSAAAITLFMLAIFAAVILAIVSRIISPIRVMTKAAVALAAGDTDINIQVKTHDEMNTLAHAFAGMAENTRLQVETIKQIADGALSVPPRMRSDKDVMNSVLAQLDATIRAQAAAIREESGRVRIMLDATPLASRLWDRRYRMIACNEAAVKLFDLGSKQEYMDRYLDLSPEIQPDGIRTIEKIGIVINEAFEKGSCVYEWLYHKLDGTPFPCETTLVRVPYGDDYAVAAYSRDLREQKKMLADINHRDHMLETINQTAEILLRCEPDDFEKTLRCCMGMMARVINADRMYLYRNSASDETPSFYRLCEWPEDAARGGSAGSPSDMQTPEINEALMAGVGIHTIVRDMPDADREILKRRGVLSLLISPVYLHNDFWGFAGFENCQSEQLFTDTEESIVRSGSLLIVNALLRNESLIHIRDTSAKLEAALADAREANNAKSSFLAHMSHEIRTPLNAVIGFSELTLDEGELKSEAKSNLEKIYNAGSTILSIVNDILDISKIESGKFELYPVEYDTPSLINDTATLNMIRIGEKNITFKLYADKNLPEKLFGDDLRVKQIFNNLLSNAFKYTAEGTVEWRITFEPDGENIWLVSSIRDTGAGIKDEDLRKLFSDYNQVDTKANRKIEGTGLGLAITKRLVEMMGGNIGVESEYGKGSTFNVRLRQNVVSEKPIGRQAAENLMSMRYTLSRRAGNSRPRVNLSYARVLLVDDVQTNLDVAKGMLKPYKINVDCALSGKQAVKMIRAGDPRYDAVFMDHMMPGMDGIEAARIIREEIDSDYARKIPIIALTANAIVGSSEMFLSRDFQDFISKPIDTVKLDAVLRAWVRDKKREEEIARNGEDNLPDAENVSPAGGGALLLKNTAIDGVDINAALENFEGDADILIDVLYSYAESTPPLLRQLDEYLGARNLADYAIIVHGIKGASYGICARETGDAARTLELAAKAGNFAEVQAGHAAFNANAETLLAAIGAALAKIETKIAE